MSAEETLRDRLIRVAKDGPFRYDEIVDRILAELAQDGPNLGPLAGIGEQLRAQDNAFTADAIFLVEKKVLDLGFDPDYADGVLCWVHSEGHVVFKETEPERYARFEAGDFSGDDDGDADDWTETGYRWRWEYVQPFLTRAAAEEYCKTRGYDHEYGLRVYVDSAHRNPEWKLLREVIGGQR